MTPITTNTAAFAHIAKTNLALHRGSQIESPAGLTFSDIQRQRGMRTEYAGGVPREIGGPGFSHATQRKMRLLDSADHALNQSARLGDLAARIANERGAARLSTESVVNLAEAGNKLAENIIAKVESAEPVSSAGQLDGDMPDAIKMVQEAIKQLGRPVRLPGIAEMQANFGMKEGATFENGDLNGDGKVDLDDFALYANGILQIWANTPMKNAHPSMDILAMNFGKSVSSMSQGDLNGDGTVNLDDFALFAANYGHGSDDQKPIPIEAQHSGFRPSHAAEIAADNDDLFDHIDRHRDKVAADAIEMKQRSEQIRATIVQSEGALLNENLLRQLTL